MFPERYEGIGPKKSATMGKKALDSCLSASLFLKLHSTGLVGKPLTLFPSHSRSHL